MPYAIPYPERCLIPCVPWRIQRLNAQGCGTVAPRTNDAMTSVELRSIGAPKQSISRGPLAASLVIRFLFDQPATVITRFRRDTKRRGPPKQVHSPSPPHPKMKPMKMVVFGYRKVACLIIN